MKPRHGPSATTLLSPAQWLLLAGALVLGAVAYAQMHAGRHPTAVAPVEISTDLLAAIGLSWALIQLRTHWSETAQRHAWLAASAGMFAIWAAESTEWLSPLLGADLEHEWFIVPLWAAAACGFFACGRVHAMRRVVMAALWFALAFQILAHASSMFEEAGLVHGGRLGALAALVDDASELLAITLYIAALVLTQFSPPKSYAFRPGSLGRKMRAINRDFGFHDPVAASRPLLGRLTAKAQGIGDGLRAEDASLAPRDIRGFAVGIGRARHAAGDAVDDLAWWRRCEGAGLPVLPTLACISLKGSTFLRGAGAFDRDLFVAARRADAAELAETFTRIAPLTFRTKGGQVLAFQDLCTELLVAAEGAELLVRPAVENHPEIAALAPSTPALFNLVTCLDGRGVPQVTHGLLRFGKQAVTVGCISGELLQGRAGAETPRQRITGWLAIKALAQAAHALFPEEALIGWDIAWTPDGPLLAGAGTEIDVARLQRYGTAPLGRSPLAPLLERHLDALVAAELRARGLT